MFKRNLGYKIVSLILAVLFWLWVNNQTSVQGIYGDQTLTIPLVLRNQPSNIMVMTKLPEIHVRLKGTNPNINVKDLFAYIDLAGSAPGKHNFDVRMDPQPQIRILDLEPSTVTLQLDSVQEKVLPVQVDLTGAPAEGYQAGQPVVKPVSVNVRGPGTILSELNKALVEVSLTGKKDTVVTSSPVLFRDKKGNPVYGPDPSVEVLSASPSSVDVVVPIQPQGLDSKDIPIHALAQGSPGGGMILGSVVSIPGDVQVFGTAEALRGFDALKVGPVDVSGLTADKSFPIPSDKITLPQGVSFAAPTTFNVLAQILPGPVEKTVSNVVVRVRNLSAGVEQAQAIPPISVTLKGLPDALKNATAAQIQLWVDAGGLAPGNYPGTRVYWQLPPGVEMVGTPKVTLSLKAHAS
ncbi:CdaR family protein [Acididesulfobacillus acetoxydans]|nr:CdaR family protein [Acididesulfobacillus acetoxydans]